MAGNAAEVAPAKGPDTMTTDEWIDAYEIASQNAIASEWFVSPLEYHWPDGKRLIDAAFQAGSSPNSNFDELVSPQLFKSAMQVDFRAKMMVFAFMREPVTKSFGLEIESGLLALYRLDFLECLSQWTYVVEGLSRQLFSVSSQSNVKSTGWTIPVTLDARRDRFIAVVASALSSYLDGVMFASANNSQSVRMSRHLLLHGNVQNKKFFSQKNCLLMLFVLDALVVVEMVKNLHFPAVFNEQGDESVKIERRKALYSMQLEHAFADQNLLKVQLLGEHP
jgi:hypothetical protein